MRPGLARPELGPPVAVVDVDVEVEVSSGTYVRALARDLGSDLGVGGHLTALRRLRVGRFDLGVAHSLEDLAAAAEREDGDGIPLVPIVEAARVSLPVHEVTAEEAVLLGHGRRIASGAAREAAVAAIDPSGRLVAVLDETAAQSRVKVVFAPTVATG